MFTQIILVLHYMLSETILGKVFYDAHAVSTSSRENPVGRLGSPGYESLSAARSRYTRYSFLWRRLLNLDGESGVEDFSSTVDGLWGYQPKTMCVCEKKTEYS